MYLKTTGNKHHLMIIKILSEQKIDYPRINRIKYLAEEKILFKNNSPTSIINWF